MKKQTFLILFLCTLTFAGIITFLDKAPTYIGKKGIQLETIQSLEDDFLHYVYRTKVQQLSKEELIAASPVTDEEIETYRTYFGTLQEQIESIKKQYKDADEEELKIRDQKIKEVRANFEDDEVVRKKVSVLKEEAIIRYLQEVKGDIQGGEKAEHFDYTVEIEGQKPIKKNNWSEVITTRSQTFPAYHDSIELPFEAGRSLTFSIPVEYKETKVTVSLLKSIYKDANYGDEIENFKWRKIAFYTVWLLTVVAIGSLIWKRKQVLEELKQNFKIRFNKIPTYVDINVLIIFCLLYISVKMAVSFGDTIENIVYNLYYSTSLLALLSKFIQVLIMLAIVATTIIFTSVVVNMWKSTKLTKQQFFSVKLYEYSKEAFYNRKIGTQMLLLLIVFTCAGFGFAVVCMEPVALIVYIPLFILIVLPALFLFLRRYSYLSKILLHAEKLANGKVVEPIKVRGDQTFAKHAANLNALQQGVKASVQAQAKSERLKTELITNVSHDLRTPLTSIITYTDLLKNEALTEEERQKYVAVLEKKSQRLKQLIEDLFEVSKMASGNMEIYRQKIDLSQLLQQIIAEHEEDLEKAHLTLRMTIAEQPLLANVDPQKLWRVFDNLLQNARKYSLENTRVYVSLSKQGEKSIFTIKNVTKYELGENVDELTERFKRGDTSRNTDGSGLGLAIAQSIVDLHGGDMQIELLGDLFQVTVILP